MVIGTFWLIFSCFLVLSKEFYCANVTVFLRTLILHFDFTRGPAAVSKEIERNYVISKDILSTCEYFWCIGNAIGARATAFVLRLLRVTA